MPPCPCNRLKLPASRNASAAPRGGSTLLFTLPKPPASTYTHTPTAKPTPYPHPQVVNVWRRTNPDGRVAGLTHIQVGRGGIGAGVMQLADRAQDACTHTCMAYVSPITQSTRSVHRWQRSAHKHCQTQRNPCLTFRCLVAALILAVCGARRRRARAAAAQLRVQRAANFRGALNSRWVGCSRKHVLMGV